MFCHLPFGQEKKKKKKLERRKREREEEEEEMYISAGLSLTSAKRIYFFSSKKAIKLAKELTCVRRVNLSQMQSVHVLALCIFSTSCGTGVVYLYSEMCALIFFS